MDISNYMSIINNYSIIQIPKTTRFWMIRTKKGYFYEEFIKANFVALGWNIIGNDTDFSEQSLATIKEYLKFDYGESRPMGAINKCKNFIHEIQKGDILLIPNSGSSFITLAEAGEYYEDDKLTFEIEKETISKIENNEYQINTVKCPYRKRRKIKVLNTIDSERLSYKLRKAISSFHGISNFDLYAGDILCSIYDCCTFQDDVFFSLNISKNEPIRPREISKLMYGLNEFFCELVDEDILSTEINLNSPGRVIIKLKEGFKFIVKQKIPLVCLFLIVTGGSAFGCEFPGIVGFIKDVSVLGFEVKEKKLELQGKELDNTLKMLEIIKDAKEVGVDIDKIYKSLAILNELDVDLQFEAYQEFDIATTSDSTKIQ